MTLRAGSFWRLLGASFPTEDPSPLDVLQHHSSYSTEHRTYQRPHQHHIAIKNLGHENQQPEWCG